MKKIFAVCAAVALLGAVLNPVFAAGGKEGANQQVTLTFWNMFTGGDGDYMRTMIDEFMKENPNIKVEALSMVEAEYYTKLPAAISVKEAPDVAIVHASRLASIMRMNNPVVSLDGYPEIAWADYPASLVQAATFNGKKIAIPLDTHPIIMYYNKTILGKAGLLKPDGTPNFQPGMANFRQYLKDIRAKVPANVIPLAATNLASNFPTWVWWVFYNQQNGPFLSPDGKTVAFNNDKALRALTDMYDMTYVDKTWPEGIRSGQEIFAAGNAAIAWGGVWAVGMIEASGVDFGVMPIPQLYDRHIAWGDSHTLIVPTQKTGAKYDASVKFANWISQHSFPWAKAGHIPANAKVAGSKEFGELPKRKDYVQAKDIIVFYPQHPNIVGVITAIRAQLEKMQTNQATPQQTLNAMITDSNKALAQ